jgi:hypothetical protein
MIEEGRRPLSTSVQFNGIDKTFFYLHVYIGRTLGRSRDKSLKSFHLCYSQSPLLTDPPLPLEQKWFETGLYIVYGSLTSENSQDYHYAQKPSTKLYVHEFGFRLRPGGMSQPEQSGEELLPNLSLRNQEHMETVKAKRNQEEKFKSRLFTSHF